MAHPADVKRWIAALVVLGCVFAAGWGVPAATAGEPKHPFMMWTAEEAAGLRKTIQTQDWAKAAYARETSNLVKYGIMGDLAAGEAEKKALLASLEGRGGVGAGAAYQYDVLYGLLSDAERAVVRKALTDAVEAAIGRMAQQKGFNRWNWLPNLGYAWYSRMHVAAAATGDEQLIRKVWAGTNGFKWYLDEYLSDLGFYNEEFSKMFNTPQGLVQWCWAMERLGLDEIGWGYRGRQGATVRGHVDSILRIGMPRVDLGTDRYFFPRLTIGDTRGGGRPALGFQHPVVAPFGDGPQRYDWYLDLLEHAHAKWPAAGYGYFLAQARPAGDKAYPMPLRLGVPPIDPAAVKPPPAPSGVYPGRGLVVLRAEETPAYWESPAPAVGMRLATAYGHFVSDSFCLTGFYAFNRPLLVNHAHATNYTGVDPGYSNSARSHSIVMVDRAEPRTLLEPVDVRHEFTAPVKFVAARGRGIFPGVDQTRALMLTREYLLDVSHLVSDRPRDYLWQIHAIGHSCPDRADQWADSADLPASLPDLGNEKCLATDGTWAVTTVQTSGGADERFSRLGSQWFKDRIGVRTTMLGAAGTRAYTAWAPVVSDAGGQWRGRSRFAYGQDEPAGAAVVATRRAATTTFAAVHEPFRTTHHIRSVRRIAQDDAGLALAVDGEGFTDYLMLRLGDAAGDRTWEASAEEAFLFANYAFVRATAARVDVEGDLRGMRIPVGNGHPTLHVRGKETPCRIADGWLTMGQVAKASALAGDRPGDTGEGGAIAARWQQPTGLCLPAGGKGKTTLKLRNNTRRALAGPKDAVSIAGSGNLIVTPSHVRAGDFLKDGLAPGAELDVPVTVDASKAPPNELLEVRVRRCCPDGPAVQSAALKVANGVAAERVQLASDFCQTIYAPRYVARYWYMDSGAAAELLDGQGYRRSDSSGTSYPRFVRQVAEGDRKGAQPVKVPKFAYFIPILIDAGPGEPRQLYEGGKHAHGTQSGLAQWFTEDWMLVLDRTAKPGETAAFDWSTTSGHNSLERTIPGRDAALAAERMPGTTIVIDADGKAHNLVARDRRAAWPAGGVTAVFTRPDGYELGSATFYHAGSKAQGGHVYQPGDKPMGFTYCTEAELAPLVKKWLDNTPTGQVDPRDAGRYNGAFMPAPVRPE